ncbi:DUF481 domain-containing protein [uncultured Shewanella sp.]|uniref:DUF481 domain-containing protein n=1 Tax=uncultured Shewanella sp. TaxID=173975 RepID=UPI002630FFEF|nr:DUF481 domain-containing protein [uncultured Shewanella sp.]
MSNKTKRHLLSHVTIGLILPLSSTVQAQSVVSEPHGSAQHAPAQLFPPADSSYDWVQLSSFEMLKGEIKNLYDDRLEFKSDELDTIFIDWEDVLVLQSHDVISVGFTDLTTKTGLLRLQRDKLYIDDQVFDRSQVMTLISGEQTESNYWSSKISLGANFRSGNAEQVDYSAIANAHRRTTESRFNLDYFGNYSKSEGVNNINNHRLNSYFDWYLSKQFYLRPIFAEIYLDPIKNIQYKATLGFGLGYDILDTPKSDWSISGGPAYTFTKFDNVATDASDNDGSGALVVESAFDTELSEDIDFNALYRVQHGNDKSGGYTHHALAGFSIELTDMFDLDLSLVWDHTNKPQADSGGVTPEKNDYQFIIGFGIDI